MRRGESLISVSLCFHQQKQIIFFITETYRRSARGKQTRGRYFTEKQAVTQKVKILHYKLKCSTQKFDAVVLHIHYTTFITDAVTWK